MDLSAALRNARGAAAPGPAIFGVTIDGSGDFLTVQTDSHYGSGWYLAVTIGEAKSAKNRQPVSWVACSFSAMSSANIFRNCCLSSSYSALFPPE